MQDLNTRSPYAARLAQAVRDMTLFKMFYDPGDAELMVDLVLRAAEQDKQEQQQRQHLSGVA